MNHRPLNEIAAEIRRNWPKINSTAKPLVDAMARLHSIRDRFYDEPAVHVLSRFLGQAGTWKGEVATRVKAEMRGILAMHEGELAREGNGRQ